MIGRNTEPDDNRQGDWLATVSGGKVYLLDPRPSDIRLADIAHGLSNLCRYGGQCGCFYSVAEHSVLVSRIAEDLAGKFLYDGEVVTAHQRASVRRWAYVGLLHDASEAYLQDIVQPLKRNLSDYGRIERRMMGAISSAFGIDWGLFSHSLIVEADRVALLTECRDLMAHHPGSTWNPGTLEPHPTFPVVGLLPEQAKVLFTDRFKEVAPS